MRVEIADTEWRTGAHSYALALHTDTLRMLAELGLLGACAGSRYPVRAVALYDGAKPRAEIRCPGEGGTAGVAVLRQDVFEQLLEDALEQAGVRVLWNHQVSRLVQDNDGVRVTINKLEKQSVGYAVAHNEWVVAESREIQTPLVIGADGHHSTVRRAMGIDFPKMDEPQCFAVFEFQSDYDAGGRMRVVLGDGTTNVLWPLPDGYFRWSFEASEFSVEETARDKQRLAIQLGGADYAVLDEGTLRRLIARRASWFTGSIGEIRWRIVVRFERRLAVSFGKDRLWLAGDAGHLTGPAGMQSMNVGLREAKELAAAMASILHEDQPLATLEDYGHQRLTEWRFLLGCGAAVDVAAADPWIAQRGRDPSLPPRRRRRPCRHGGASRVAGRGTGVRSSNS